MYCKCQFNVSSGAGSLLKELLGRTSTHNDELSINFWTAMQTSARDKLSYLMDYLRIFVGNYAPSSPAMSFELVTHAEAGCLTQDCIVDNSEGVMVPLKHFFSLLRCELRLSIILDILGQCCEGNACSAQALCSFLDDDYIQALNNVFKMQLFFAFNIGAIEATARANEFQASSSLACQLSISVVKIYSLCMTCTIDNPDVHGMQCKVRRYMRESFFDRAPDEDSSPFVQPMFTFVLPHAMRQSYSLDLTQRAYEAVSCLSSYADTLGLYDLFFEDALQSRKEIDFLWEEVQQKSELESCLKTAHDECKRLSLAVRKCRASKPREIRQAVGRATAEAKELACEQATARVKAEGELRILHGQVEEVENALDQTKEFLRANKLEHERTVKELTDSKIEIDNLRKELARERESHKSTNVALEQVMVDLRYAKEEIIEKEEACAKAESSIETIGEELIERVQMQENCEKKMEQTYAKFVVLARAYQHVD